MIAAGVLVDPWCAAEFAGDNQQNLVAQSALFDVTNERRDRHIDGSAASLHFLDQTAVHVPAGTADGHESATGFAQSASHQHLVAQGSGVALVGVLFRVVKFEGLAIFLRNVKGVGRAAENYIEGLLLKAVGPFERAAGCDMPLVPTDGSRSSPTKCAGLQEQRLTNAGPDAAIVEL